MKTKRLTGAYPFVMLLMFIMTTGAAMAGDLRVAVTADDQAVARRARPGYVHVFPRKDSVAGAQASPLVNRYNDLIYRGGPVVTAIQSHNIYVNAPSTTWGDPATFLTDLGVSMFIRVLDQYMPAGVTGAGRYVNGVAVSATI